MLIAGICYRGGLIGRLAPESPQNALYARDGAWRRRLRCTSEWFVLPELIVPASKAGISNNFPVGPLLEMTSCGCIRPRKRERHDANYAAPRQ